MLLLHIVEDYILHVALHDLTLKNPLTPVAYAEILARVCLVMKA